MIPNAITAKPNFCSITFLISLNYDYKNTHTKLQFEIRPLMTLHYLETKILIKMKVLVSHIVYLISNIIVLLSCVKFLYLL